MADDIAITPGTGATVATEDVAGVHHQKVKVEFGADTVATMVSNADPLPVVITGPGGEEALVSEGGAVSTTVDNAVVVKGVTAHDVGQDAAAISPVPIGGNASAAAPTAVNADNDAVLAWFLRNGAQATAVTAAGALIGGDATNGLDVDVTRLPSLVAGSANIGDVDVASIAAGDNNIGNVDIVTLPALPAGSNAIGKLAANTGVDIGDVDVTSVVPGTAATNLGKAEDAGHTSGDVGVMALAVRTDTPTTRGADVDYHPFQTNSVGGLWVSEVADPAGGCSVFKSLDLDETEEEIKATPGCVYGWYAFNNRSTKVYLKFYNLTAANVTVGTQVPVMTFPIPAGETVGVAANMGFAPGILFNTAITVAATTGAADNDTGAPAAGDCIVNIFYK